MSVIKKTKTFEGTWCERKGTAITFHFDSRNMGKRVVAYVWADAPGETELRAIKGDGRTLDFRVYEKKTVATTNDAVLRSFAVDLADKHFA